MLREPAFWAMLSALAWGVGAFWQMWIELEDQYRNLRSFVEVMDTLQREEVERKLAAGSNKRAPLSRSRAVREVTKDLEDVLTDEERRQLQLHLNRVLAWTIVLSGAVLAGVAAGLQLWG